VNLWIPDVTGHDAIGELPESVALGLIPRVGEQVRRYASEQPLVNVVEHGY
jgi:hypothetical protein